MKINLGFENDVHRYSNERLIVESKHEATNNRGGRKRLFGKSNDTELERYTQNINKFTRGTFIVSYKICLHFYETRL